MPDPYSREVYSVPPSGGVRVPDFRRRNRLPDEEEVTVAAPRESDVMGFQRALVGGEGDPFNTVAHVPTTSGSFVDSRGTQIGPRAARFMEATGPTVIPNPRSGRVAITGDQAMTADQRARVANMATAEQGYKQPLTATINGQSFVMPASGPRVSQAKASQFLALDAQERQAAEAKAERDRAFQAEQTARQAAADRQARMDEMAALDRREARIANRDTRQRTAAREDYAFGRQQAADARADATRLTPEQERERATYQAILDNPNASPRAKSLATQGMARLGGVSDDISAELGRPSAQANAAPVLDAINNDPLVAGRIAELQRTVTRAQDLPWYQDLANIASLGFYEGEAATPEVQAIQSEVAQIAQAVADQYGLDVEAARQAILNQILPGLTDQTPGVSRQIRTALR